MIEPKYYECHITVEPVDGERLLKLASWCQHYGFKPATLLMQKSLKINKLDSFCTGKDKSFENLKTRMVELLQDLKEDNFHIYRYKIEAILLDSK